jgi:hypothetical protein
MSLSTGLYSYQFDGSTVAHSPEAYGHISYSNNEFHGASVQNMQLVEYLNVAPVEDTFPVFRQRGI